MKIKYSSYSNELPLLSSLLFLIAGTILFTKTEQIVQLLSIWSGVTLFILAIVEFVLFYVSIKNGSKSFKNFVFCLITVAIALILILFSSVVELFIRFIIGAWILISGIKRLISSFQVPGKKKIPVIIVSIILISIGLYTIIKSNVLLKTLGLIMMIYAIFELIAYIIDKIVNHNEVKESNETTLIIPEDEPKNKIEKKKNIKDVEETEKK